MPKTTEKDGASSKNKKAIIDFALLAGLFAFRYKDVLIHKALGALIRKAMPYLVVALIVLIALVAGLTFAFVKLFS